jgi:glycerol-3-phosphate dehydrogenase
MAEREKRPLPGSGSYSRDACFLLPRLFPHPYAIAVQGRTRDPDALLSRAARHLFLVPWRHYTLCGVWHKVWTDGPDHVHVTEAELQGFIDEINAAMPGVAARLSDVSMWNAGLVPFGDNAPGAAHLSYGKRSRIVDHEAAQGISNLVSLVGVRYTMARADAAEAVDLVCAKLKQRGPRPPTTRLRLMGGDFDRFADLVAAVARAAPPGLNGATIEALAHNYGTQYGHVFSCLRRPLLSAECLKGSTTLRAEIVHAARREMAVRLSDIVFRRTDLATGGHPGRDALEEAAGLAARELGWDAATRRSEIAAVEKRFASGGRFAAEESVATAFEMHAAGGVNPA